MVTSWIFSVVLFAAPAATIVEPSQASTFESRTDLAPQGKIDELVFDGWKRLGIPPANLCSDAVFVRRVYLDVIGTLPTADEARQFLQDKDPNKRRTLIDRLLERDEFADYWAMKWSDLLRIKAEFPINLWPHAAQAYHRWIRTCIRENRPYDRFVREMLTANGSNFRVPQVNFYRAMQAKEPQATARTVALTFMGARAENWPKERLAGMAAFFSQITYKATAEWKEEIVFYDPSKAVAMASDATAKVPPAAAVYPDGAPAQLTPGRDPRTVFADWLIAPQNPWFTRNIVNRIWSWLLGRGIIHEPDDIRPDNLPSNPELLSFLEKELVGAHYDLKHIYRLILNSTTYQLSPIAKTQKPEGATQFARYPLRRLEAEVLIDALCQITGTTESYSSAIPEPFTFIPESHRSISLPDGSITSSFLEQFGHPSRDTGLELERNNRLTGDQRLHMLNSSHIRRKLEQSPKLQALIQAAVKPVSAAAAKTPPPKAKTPGRPPRPESRDNRAGAELNAPQIYTELYLTILSRFPTEEELAVVGGYAKSRNLTVLRAKDRDLLVDVAWALINSSEFLYRH